MLEKETKQTTYCLYAVIALTFVNILAGYAVSDTVIESAETTAYSFFEENVRIVSTLLNLGSFVVVARWTYLAAKINHDAGLEGLKYSPMSSLAWFFIPVMNLWKPYFAVKEHYLARLQSSSFPSPDAKTTFRLWWFSFVAANILANTSYSQTYSSGEILETNAIFAIASGIALLLSCLALIKIIKQFTAGSE